MAIQADATLVNAAYRMGMANVPADTSRIFQQQYEALAGIETAKLEMFGDIVEGVGELAETGVKAHYQIKDAKQRKEWDKQYVNVMEDNVYSEMSGAGDHKIKVDEATKEEAQRRLEAIRDERDKLRDSARTPEQRKKLAKMDEAIHLWRQENNELLAVGQVHFDNFKNGNVDMNNSFKDPKTGKKSDLLMAIYRDVMDPSVNLDEANIQVQYRSGQRGYSFDSKEDRLALHYKMLKDKNKVDLVDEGEKADAGITEQGTSWISHDELMSYVKLKDKGIEATLGGVMTKSLEQGRTNKPVYIDNGDGTRSKSKSVAYAVGDYSEVSATNQRQFFESLMATTQDDGEGNQVSRDPHAGIDYINNNKILVGGTEVDYREHSKSNPMIASASYADLGLTGSVDKDGNQVIDTDELTKEDKTAIHDLLMNPKTPEQYEVAAMEIARYFDLQTKSAFEAERGNDIKKSSTTDDNVTPDGSVTPVTGNFDHINKGAYIPLAGVSVQKGSLENIRTDIENRTPGGFYLGPKDDEKAFVPVGKSGWEQRDGSGEVLATYNSVSELIKSGLKTSDRGFRSLITMDVDSDGTPDGPLRLFNTDFSK